MDHQISTRVLIQDVADGAEDEPLTLGGLLDRFQERAFGVFLLISVLPAFVPLPVGAGAISGPLVMLIGLQLMVLMDHPWVPGFVSRRRLSRQGMQSFRKRTTRLLSWVEKISRPRAEILIDHRAARMFTGLLLALLGFLLALPLPATNYPFGLILLVYAIALIERDGRLLAIGWVLGVGELVVMGLASGQIAAWVKQLLA